jgi:uncharacterized protein
MMTVEAIVSTLSLEPHPEGGFFRETFRDARLIDGRAVSTAIYFLLAQGQHSHWHRIDANEVWHWYCGAPLALALKDGEVVKMQKLGCNILEGERPQLIVPAGTWQSAESLGAWTLVGCTVAPGFEFRGFELAKA